MPHPSSALTVSSPPKTDRDGWDSLERRSHFSTPSLYLGNPSRASRRCRVICSLVSPALSLSPASRSFPRPVSGGVSLVRHLTSPCLRCDSRPLVLRPGLDCFRHALFSALVRTLVASLRSGMTSSIFFFFALNALANFPGQRLSPPPLLPSLALLMENGLWQSTT